MKVKTTRVHFDRYDVGGKQYEPSLEYTLNEIGYENILQILPTYHGGGEVMYTIIYKEET